LSEREELDARNASRLAAAREENARLRASVVGLIAPTLTSAAAADGCAPPRKPRTQKRHDPARPFAQIPDPDAYTEEMERAPEPDAYEVED